MKKAYILLVIIILSFSLFAYPRAKDYVIVQNESTRADSAHGFDITNYDITMELDDANDFISGSVTAIVEAEEVITEIVYELTSMTVSNVLLNGNPATYDYTNDLITIQLGIMNPGDIFTTQVDYEGYPIWDGLGMYFGTNHIFTISDPNASRYWWPCYDHPWDKAVTDLHITVRDDWLVASNGIRTSIVDNGNGTRTHHWDCNQPMATYLVSLSRILYLQVMLQMQRKIFPTYLL